MEINWFPGHMAKSLRKMKEQVKLVDLIIETCDARIPESSRNPELAGLTGDKPLILVLNKADLADPETTQQWLDYYTRQGLQVLAIDSTKRNGPDQVQNAAIKLMQAKIDRSKERGRIFQPVRAMIVGIPNTGKSTLINTLVRRKAAQAQDKPGVTRRTAWVRSGGQLELLDTPGVLMPKIESKASQIVLAATGAIRDVILDLEEIAARVIHMLDVHYPRQLAERYQVGRGVIEADRDGDMADDSGNSFSDAHINNDAHDDHAAESMLIADPELAAGYQLLEAAALMRKCLQSGGRADTARFAVIFLDELRGGRIGRISLEWPPKKTERAK